MFNQKLKARIAELESKNYFQEKRIHSLEMAIQNVIGPCFTEIHEFLGVKRVATKKEPSIILVKKEEPK